MHPMFPAAGGAGVSRPARAAAGAPHSRRVAGARMRLPMQPLTERLTMSSKDSASSRANAADPAHEGELDRLYAMVSQYFGLFAEPMRLKIMHAVCDKELSVNEVLAAVGGTQANVSRHLTQMHRAGVLGRRKEGVSVFYRVADENAVLLCRTVCVQLAARMDEVRAEDGALSDATVERFMTGAT
jgi:DNA-binding transcriptional ArsR family regulator